MACVADLPVRVPTALGDDRPAYCTLIFIDDRSVQVRVGREPTGEATDDAGVDLTAEADGSTERYRFGELDVHVSRAPLQIGLLSPNGNRAAQLTVVDTSPSSDFGQRSAGAYEIHIVPADLDARIYGCGERFDQVDQSGKVVLNDSTDLLTSKYDFTYAPIPWFMSTDGYGFLQDTTRASLFDFRTRRHGRYEVRDYQPTDRSETVFTLFYGPDLRDVLQAYVRVSGKPRLMPEWAFHPLMGPAYPKSFDRERLQEYLTKLREHDLPHGTFYLDGYWEIYVGDLESRDHPDIKAFIDEVHEHGYRVVFWTAPWVSTAARCVPEGIDNGYFLQQASGVGAEPDTPRTTPGPHNGWWGHYIDFTNTEAIAWHQERVKALLRAGADGFFADFGETQDIRTATFSDGNDGESAGRYYTIPYHEAIHAACQEVRGDDFYLTSRSGWTGLQRYAGIVTGDQGTSYDFIPVAMAALQTGGLSGVPYMSHCLGGYWGDHAKGPFLRWVQLGVFGSLFSIWNQGSNTEPWSFDDPEVIRVYRTYARLRMELMPHIYSYATRAAHTGLPMTQALGFAFPEDRAAGDWEDQYLFGEEFLVAPIYTPDNVRPVYLPAGCDWYDLWTDTAHHGGQTMRWPAPLDTLPVFVREGSVVASTHDQTIPGLRLTVYPGAGRSMTVHHDDSLWQVTTSRTPDGGRTVNVDTTSNAPLYLRLVAQPRPSTVVFAGTALPEVSGPADLRSVSGWCHDDRGVWVRGMPPVGEPFDIVCGE